MGWLVGTEEDTGAVTIRPGNAESPALFHKELALPPSPPAKDSSRLKNRGLFNSRATRRMYNVR